MDPRLRRAVKTPAAYPLNDFSKETLYKIARSLVSAQFVRRLSDLTGPEWENIFAQAIGAEWKPSNIGLDDVVKLNTCWGAKTVKSNQPHTIQKIRLISGRNSLDYSFGDKNIRDLDPNEVGSKVISIWNARVAEVRVRFPHVRTVVLVKGPGLTKASLFEFETLLVMPELLTWQWNSRRNLEGFHEGEHRFTWQPHGAQFTIIEPVPDKLYKISIKPPSEIPKITEDSLLEMIDYSDDWVTVES